MKKAIRRLTIYPGQISMVFNLSSAEEFHDILRITLPEIQDPMRRTTVECFLDKMERAITTGKNLKDKKSALARENC